MSQFNTRQLCLFMFFFWVKLSFAQVGTLTFNINFDEPSAQSEWTSFYLGVDPEFYEWQFIPGGIEGDCLAHFYPVGGQETTDNWIVSSAFNFSGGASVDSIWTAFGGFGMPQKGDSILFYVLNGSNDPALAEKVLLRNFTDENYQNDITWRVDTDLVIDPLPGDSYLAFRYRTVVNWLDVKIDNIQLSVFNSTSVSELPVVRNELYPNPCHNFFQLERPIQNAILKDSQGNIVQVWQGLSAFFRLDEMAAGMYFLEYSEDKIIARKKIVVH